MEGLESRDPICIKRRKLEYHAIWAVTGDGLDELKWALARPSVQSLTTGKGGGESRPKLPGS
jgi:hypothetical protein